MWDAIGKILTSENTVATIVGVILIIFMFVVMVSAGFLNLNFSFLKIGRMGKNKDADVKWRQVKVAHEFISSLEGKINVETMEYNGYFTKYILERVYDKVLEWIIFNHISTSTEYVQDKQESICNLVYLFNVDKDFRTPEFKKRMCNWTEELIERLVKTREVYG
ncbi:MAG: hypothetical protein IJP62_13875 [Treponema sp.]|nr:hypothetical protein [Treponema sp.]